MFDDELEGREPAQEPYWLAALSGLFGPDPQTGWVDTDAALEAMAWLGQQVFAQAQADRGLQTRVSLQRQVEATARVSNSLAAIQAVRIAQFCATSVDYAVIRKTGADGGPDTGGASGGDGRPDGGPGAGLATGGASAGGDRTEARWVGETAHAPAGALQGVPAGPGVLPGQTREVWHPLGYKTDYADTEVGAGLWLGPVAASNRVEEAIDAVTKTPRLLAEVAAGRFDAYRLAQVTRELVEAGDVTCARVEDELLTRGVIGWTARQVQQRARTLVRRVDPAAARTVKRKRAKDAINVFTRPGREEGTTEVQAVLWSKDALAAFSAVEDLARALHRDTTTGKTLGECRADAMVDLILNNTAVTTNVTLLAPVNTRMTGSGTQPTPEEEDGQPASDTRQPPGGNGESEQARPGDGEDEQGHESGGRGPVRHVAPTGLEADLEEQLAHTDWDREFVQFFDPPDPPIRLDLRLPDASGSSGEGGGPSSRQPAMRGLDPVPPLRSAAYLTSPVDACSTSPVGETPCCPVGQSQSSPAGGFSEVEVPGIGVIPADAVHAMAQTVGATIARALVDQDTGTLVAASTRTYRPTAAIRRFVQQRDMHCRFPTCARDAAYCDVDHVIPWPDGQTTPANLQLLCRHHHRAKHEGGWQVTMTPDGVCTWTSSTGHTYTTLPGLTDIISDLTITPGPGPLSAAHEATAIGVRRP